MVECGAENLKMVVQFHLPPLFFKFLFFENKSSFVQ